mgnify:CR=1 FL=1
MQRIGDTLQEKTDQRRHGDSDGGIGKHPPAHEVEVIHQKVSDYHGRIGCDRHVHEEYNYGNDDKNDFLHFAVNF